MRRFHIPESDKMRSLRSWLCYELAVNQIATHFDNLMNGLPSDLPEVARKLFEFWKNQKSVILTFNYDTIVENGLSQSQKAYWTAYWKLPTKLVAQRGEQPPIGFFGDVDSDEFLRSLAEPANYPTVLKLHGSYNWLIPDGSVGADEIYYFRHHSSEGQGFRSAGLRPFIVPPSVDKSSLTKHSLISKMWLMARGFIENCQRLFIIGYSLPLSDTYVNLFLSKSLSPHTKVVVVNSDESSDFTSRMADQLMGRLNLKDSFLGDKSIDCFVNWLATGS
jgi:hypothetical protein